MGQAKRRAMNPKRIRFIWLLRLISKYTLQEIVIMANHRY